MKTLENKIDFAVVVNVMNANPNGDPLNGNRPRTNYDGTGELSDVCIKRKIRNRLMDEGYSIFVQSDDKRTDDFRSLRSRAEGTIKIDPKKENEFRDVACSTWLDVRAFGQVFAFKKKTNSKTQKDKNAEDQNNESDSTSEESSSGVSIGVRGPVSIHPAFSIAPVLDQITSIQITKSVNGEDVEGNKKASDTMGMKHRVDHGVYVFYGSINPQLAERTGFSDDDAQLIKKAISTLFRNDASSARPEGSMEVHRVYWWQHNTKIGQYSSAKVHNSVRNKIRVKDGVNEPKNISDYIIPGKEEIEKELPGLICEVIEGE
jgi:CRISPR-associated protein Csd2